MKKLISVILMLALTVSILTACGSGEAPATNPADSGPASVETKPAETAMPETEPKEAYEIISKKANTWVDSIGTTWVQTIIEVENTGSVNLYMSSCSYDLEDASGSLVAAHDYVSVYPQILAPGEKGVIYHSTTLDESIEGELTVLPHEDIVPAKVDLIRFPITDFSLSDTEYMGLNMKGRVENTTDEEVTLVYVAAILYDADGACIGVNFTIIDKIKAGDKVGFDANSFALPDFITADDVASYEVFAYANQYQF